jgi:Flp pilus assembly pilin Flp
MDRVHKRVDLVAAGLYLARTRQPAQGFIEFALLIVVLVAVASVGLAILGTDLQSLFEALGGKLKLPAGF